MHFYMYGPTCRPIKYDLPSREAVSHSILCEQALHLGKIACIISGVNVMCPHVQDGTFSYPEDGADFKYLLELRAEAEYYCLSSLVEQIDRFPVSFCALIHMMYCILLCLCLAFGGSREHRFPD